VYLRGDEAGLFVGIGGAGCDWFGHPHRPEQAIRPYLFLQFDCGYGDAIGTHHRPALPPPPRHLGVYPSGGSSEHIQRIIEDSELELEAIHTLYIREFSDIIQGEEKLRGQLGFKSKNQWRNTLGASSTCGTPSCTPPAPSWTTIMASSNCTDVWSASPICWMGRSEQGFVRLNLHWTTWCYFSAPDSS
jgi:hypothetical protein